MYKKIFLTLLSLSIVWYYPVILLVVAWVFGLEWIEQLFKSARCQHKTD